MTECRNCQHQIITLKKQLAQVQAQLRKEKSFHRQDIQIYQQKLKDYISRENYQKSLNQTLSNTLKNQQNNNQSKKQFDIYSQRSASRSTSRKSQIVDFQDKENLSPNRIKAKAIQFNKAKTVQTTLKKQNQMLKQQIHSIKGKLQKYRNMLFEKQQKKSEQQSSFQSYQSDYRISQVSLSPSIQLNNYKKKTKGSFYESKKVSIIECSVCQMQFRPVQFMNHLQNCK